MEPALLVRHRKPVRASAGHLGANADFEREEADMARKTGYSGPITSLGMGLCFRDKRSASPLYIIYSQLRFGIDKPNKYQTSGGRLHSWRGWAAAR